MKIETQPLEDHQVKLTVEVESNSFEAAKKRAARQYSKRTKIPGFRPGKAPYQVVVRQVGEAAIIEEALDLLVQDIYPKVLDEAEIKPYGPGKLENIVSMEPPVLEFVVPLEAEVDLGDYRSIRRPYEPKSVTDKDVNDVLEDLQDRQAVLEPVERPAQEGDMVYVRLSGVRKQVEEGENPNLISERSLPVLLKSEKIVSSDEVEQSEQDDSEEWPFPGFSRNLIGLSAGNELTLTHTFSEDSDFESLRGVEAEYHVVVEDVKSRTLPELNDEFATSVGEYENLDTLRSDIRSGLEQQALQKYNEEYDTQVIDEAVEQATLKYPPQMLDREVDSVIDGLKHRLEQQGLDLDLYLKTREMDMEALREEALPVAETRLKRSLFLFELAKAENIEVEQEDLQNETLRTMDSLSQTLSEKEARQLADQRVFSNLVGSIMADMLTEKSVEKLRQIASGQLDEQAALDENDLPAEETLPASEEETAQEVDAESETMEEAAKPSPGEETTEAVLSDEDNSSEHSETSNED